MRVLQAGVQILFAFPLTLLFAAMVGAVPLVLEVLVSRVAAVSITGMLAAAFILLWLVVPYRAGRRA